MPKSTVNPYLLTEQDKQDIIKRLTEDITWGQDELVDSEQDVSNTELVDQDEEMELF